MIDRLYTSAEAARHFGVKEATVRRWMNEGAISFVMLGGKFRRITEEQINDFIERNTKERKEGK